MMNSKCHLHIDHRQMAKDDKLNMSEDENKISLTKN